MTQPKIRYRERTDFKSVPIIYLWEGDGFVPNSSLGSWLSLSYYNTISDVVGTPKTQRVKPCIHRTAGYFGLTCQPFIADYGKVVRFPDGLYPGLPLGGSIFDEPLAVPHSVRVQAAGRAFTAFATRFPSKISAAEFVQGIAQVKELLPKLEQTITQTITSLYLTKKFGWDNLLSDLNAMATSIGSIRSRMEFLKKTYGKPTKLYHREPEFHSVAPFTILDERVRGFGWRYTLDSYRADFTAGCSLIQLLTHIDDFIGWLRAIVISLGLNNPLLAFWQTSRLSFVVDWFVDVSGHLARLAAVQPGEEWSTSNISSTVVWGARINVTQVNRGMLGGVPDQERYLGFFDIRQYERFVGLPVDLTIFTPSTCTPDQLELMLAMAVSKSR